MKRFSVFVVLIFSSYLSPAAPTVRMAKLLEDGYLMNQDDPIGKAIEFPQNYNGTEVTVCFWLQPYRYLRRNSILSFSQSFSGVSTLAFSLHEGNFTVGLHNCFLSLDIKLKIREWSHFCFSKSENVKIFIGGNLDSIYECNSELSFMTNEDNFFRIGWDAVIANSFSGLIADANIFWRELSNDEIKNISLIENAPLGLDLLFNLSTDNNSYAKITEVPVEELLEEYMPYILLYISKRNTYQKAARICEVRRGLLPDLNEHGKETLIKLMLKFSSGSGISFDSFWLNSVNDSTCFTGTFAWRQFDIIESSLNCSNVKRNYFCVVNKEIKFRLVGFADDQDILFHPVPNQIDVFESENMLRLHFKNEHFILKNVYSNFVYFESVRKDSEHLFGRYEWSKPYNKQNAMMVFSACNFDDFTCSDGVCIDFEDLCQYQKDCDDYSDEDVDICEVGFLPESFYDKRLPPSANSNYTTKISIDLKLLRVLDVNKEENTINILLDCALKWQDERLKFKFLKQNESVVVSEDIAKEFWLPEVIIIGAIHDDKSMLSFRENPGKVKARMLENGTFKLVNSYRAMHHEGKQVLLSGENSVSVTLFCNMDLFFFPFDEQTCSFSLKLLDQNEIFSDIKFERNISSISIGSKVFLGDYDLIYFKYEFTDSKKVDVSIKFGRKFGALIFNMFSVCIMLEITAILTFLLPTQSYDDREASTIAILLTMATLFSQLIGNIPKSAEPKLLDIWMFGHVLVLTQVYLLHMIVIYYDDVEAKANIGKKLINGKNIRDEANGVPQIEKNSRTFLAFFKDSFENLKLVKRFRKMNLTCQQINDYLLVVNIIVYGSFLLIFYLAAGRHIDDILKRFG